MALFLPPTPALAYDAPGPRWSGTTIRVHETFPPSWNWSLQRAFETWNNAGAKIRFREVRGGREQVTLGYGDTGGYAGLATMGRRTGAFLRVDRVVRDGDMAPARARVQEFSQRIARELPRVFSQAVEQGGAAR